MKQTVTMRAKIVDAHNNGISNNLIKIFNMDDVFVDAVITDSDGNFEINLKPGRYKAKNIKDQKTIIDKEFVIAFPSNRIFNSQDYREIKEK